MRQKGFTGIEALITIVTLCVFASVGWYAYGSIKAEQKSETVAQTKTPSHKEALNVTPEATKIDIEQESIEFKELGVKIKQTESLRSLSYKEAANTKSFYNITTPDFEKYDTHCAGYFAQVYKGAGNFADSKTPGTLLKQFDTFYVAANFPDCALNSDLGVKYTDALKQAFQTAEAL